MSSSPPIPSEVRPAPRAARVRAALHRRLALLRDEPEAGMSTAEYAVGTVAACAFAMLGLLLAILTLGLVVFGPMGALRGLGQWLASPYPTAILVLPRVLGSPYLLWAVWMAAKTLLAWGALSYLAALVLRHTMWRHAQAGYVATSLDVDSVNPSGANALYESVGFRVTRTWTNFLLEA